MKPDPTERLKAAVHRLQLRPPPPALELRPTNPFEVQVAERLKNLDNELDQVRTRINWILTVIIGAALTNIIISLLK